MPNFNAEKPSRRPNTDANQIPQSSRVQDVITALERRIVRYQSACLSSLSRPIDHQNLYDAHLELSSLRMYVQAA